MSPEKCRRRAARDSLAGLVGLSEQVRFNITSALDDGRKAEVALAEKEEEVDAAFERGESEGRDAGYSEGYSRGQHEGRQEGRNSGYEEGKREGMHVGRQDGYQEG